MVAEMNIFTGIILVIVTIILAVFVSYLLWRHSKREIDTRPEDVENLAAENGWEFSKRSERLSQLISDHDLGYMGKNVAVRYVCSQKQENRHTYIFDCLAATPISGVAIQFENRRFLPVRVAERLIINRLNKHPADSPIKPDRLPRFVQAKVLANAPADCHDPICELIAENNDLQALLKRRDLGYFGMQANVVVFYFLTCYPADERGFSKVVKRAEEITQIFGN